MSQVLEFLKILWPEPVKDHYLTLWRLPDKISQHIPSEDVNAVATVAELWHRSEKDVYIGVGLRRADYGASRRGKIQCVGAAPGLFLEIDFQAPEGAHKADNQVLPQDLQASIRFLEEAAASPRLVPGPPTAIVLSGHGIHVYYCFDKPFVWEKTKDKRISLLLKKFENGFRELAEKQGLQIDGVAELSRVLRVPGTSNLKIPGEPKPVVLLPADGPRPRYAIEELERVARTGTFAKVGRPSKQGSGIAPVPPPRGAFEWWDEVYLRCTRLVREESLELMRLVYAKESFASRGNRDNEMNRAAKILASVAFNVPGVTAESLAEVFRGSFTKWAAEPGSNSVEFEMGKVIEKLGRGLVAAQEREEKNREIMASAFKREKRDSAVVKEADDEDADDEDEPPSVPIEVQLRHKIIIKQNAYFLYQNGTYMGPVHEKELFVAIRDVFEHDSDVSWYYENDEGDSVRKDLKQFLNDYATRANDIIYDYVIKNSYFNTETHNLYLAAAPIRNIPAVFDQRVDAWLRILAGENSDKLLDWIATLADLDRQSCAIYLSGPPGTGKSFLSHGLAALWRDKGGPTELSLALSSFPTDLLTSPFVVADEALPKDCPITALRDLIGQSAFMVPTKYMPTAKLNGSIRLMILANNDQLLATESDPSADDLQAVADRFLHLEVPAAAREYLEGINTRNWLERDVIAKHARWLMENRKVKSGKRFLVTGHETRMLRKLVLRQHSVRLVLEAIVRSIWYLAQPNAQPMGEMVYGDGEFLTCPQTVIGSWKLRIESHKVLSTNAIVKALTAVSYPETRMVGDTILWNVKPEFIRDGAMMTFGGTQVVDRVLAGPRVTRVTKPNFGVLAGGAEQEKDPAKKTT